MYFKSCTNRSILHCHSRILVMLNIFCMFYYAMYKIKPLLLNHLSVTSEFNI